MIAHVLVLLCGACAVSMAADDNVTYPGYVQAWAQHKELVKTLEQNIISMTDNIPLLNDSRRHYAVIFNVIGEEAFIQSLIGSPPYDESYIPDLDISVPEGVRDPGRVINKIVESVDAVEEQTKDINKWAEHCLAPEDLCNEWIHKLVEADPEKYKIQAEVLLAAGEATRLLNEQAELYRHAAEELDALHFVVNGQEVLKEPVLALAVLFRYLQTP